MTVRERRKACLLKFWRHLPYYTYAMRARNSGWYTLPSHVRVNKKTTYNNTCISAGKCNWLHHNSSQWSQPPFVLSTLHNRKNIQIACWYICHITCFRCRLSVSLISLFRLPIYPWLAWYPSFFGAGRRLHQLVFYSNRSIKITNNPIDKNNQARTTLLHEKIENLHLQFSPYRM